VGVPAKMGSCHTAEVGGYSIEGHVPIKGHPTPVARTTEGAGIGGPGDAGRLTGYGGSLR
jgi:hypothetical protein